MRLQIDFFIGFSETFVDFRMAILVFTKNFLVYFASKLRAESGKILKIRVSRIQSLNHLDDSGR